MNYSIVIVGAGLAGLSAAMRLYDEGVRDFLVLDYQQEPGGFTRLYKQSPQFAVEQALLDQADRYPLPFQGKSTVIGFFTGENGARHQIFVQSAGGDQTLKADMLLYAAGAMEKPREALKIPGSRPAGIMTPYMAAELMGRGYLPGKRIVLYDNGRIASCVGKLLQEAGCEVSLVMAAREQINRIHGKARLESITVMDRISGKERIDSCDTLIFAQGRYPCTFCLKGLPIELEDAAVSVREDGSTNLARVYAAGSCTSIGDDQHVNSPALGRRAADTMLQHLMEERR